MPVESFVAIVVAQALKINFRSVNIYQTVIKLMRKKLSLDEFIIKY